MIPLCPPTCLYLEVPLTSPSPAPRVEIRNLTPCFDVESTLTPYSTRLEAANQPPVGSKCTLTSYPTQHPRSSHPVSQLLRPRQHLYLILHNQPAVLTSPPLCPPLRPSTERRPSPSSWLRLHFALSFDLSLDLARSVDPARRRLETRRPCERGLPVIRMPGRHGQTALFVFN